MSNHRQIFASTSCLSEPKLLDELIDYYSCHGITKIELGAGIIIGEKGLSALNNNKCEFLIHNYFPPPTKPFVLNLASPDKRIREQSLSFVKQTLQLCHELSIPFYSIHAGFLSDPIGFGSNGFIFPESDQRHPVHAAMDHFIQSVMICASEARNLGVELIIENNVCIPEHKGKLLLQSTEEFLDFFHSIPDSLPVGVLLDTGHLQVSAQTLGYNKMDFAYTIGPYIRAFHVHENDGHSDSHQPIKENSWILDLLTMKDFSEYPIILEAKFHTIIELQQHIDWLSSVIL